MIKKFLKKVFDPLQYLFWRMQIGALFACPPLWGFALKRSVNASSSRRSWIKTFFWLAVQAPYVLFLYLRGKVKKRIELGRMTLPVTLRCTLNCDKCVARVPDLKSSRDISLDELRRDLESLFACVDYIYLLEISGGEAFLHPDLDEIIRLCAKPGKVNHIRVHTNATVMPNEKLLAALRETKVSVQISGYPQALQPNVEQLKDVLKKNGIFILHEFRSCWFDCGDFGQRQAGSEQRRFSVCIQRLLVPFCDGKLHFCSESVLLMKEERIPDCKEDYVDLRSTDPAEFRRQWKRMLKKRSISACSHCLGCTYKSPKIPVAVQRERD